MMTEDKRPFSLQTFWHVSVGKVTGVNNEMNDGWSPFRSLSHCHGLLGHLNRLEPSLTLLLTPVLFLLCQVKVSAEKKAYKDDYEGECDEKGGGGGGVCCYLFVYSPADWSAWGNLETEFWSVASFDFMILRPSVNRISWPFRNFSIWRSTPTTWCLSMHVCEESTSAMSRTTSYKRVLAKHFKKGNDFPTSERAQE